MAAKCTGRVPERNEDRTWKRDDNGDPITRPCRNHPVRGAKVCPMHGGKAGQVKAKAGERVTEQKARRELGKLSAILGPADAVADPLTELGKLAGEVVRWKDLLAEHVAELQRIRYEDAKGGEQLRSEVALWERALDRCTTVLATMARLNIDERLAAINERQADRVLRAIDLALEAAGIEPSRRGEAKLAAARHLRAVN